MSERSSSKKVSRASSQYAGSTTSNGVPKKPSRSFSMKSQKPPEEKLQQRFSKAVNYFLKAPNAEKKLPAIRELRRIIELAWDIPVIGRDFAYDLSDALKQELILTYVVEQLKIDSESNRSIKPLLRDIQQECASLLEQILTTDNRQFVARNFLETIGNFTKVKDDVEIIRINTGILEAMFKDSEHTCSRLIELGSLDTILHACRHDDLWTARHCAAAIANATIFGGTVNHRKMVEKGAAEWLFPLAFRNDDYCRFYSCLAITVLASNPLVENAVIASGTLKLVEPFVKTHDPYEFAISNPSHAQGRAASFLQRLIPLLLADQPETQALASFYFAMEASIKAKQQKTQIFSEICAIVPLKRVVATSRSTTARTLASRCMKIIGEEVPKKLSPQVHLWDMDDVQSWLTIAGFRAFQTPFKDSAVDGEMLLLLTEKELMNEMHMTNTVHRKRFIRDLNRLRSGADYRSCDPSNICDWLRRVDAQFAQYTLPLVRAGIDRKFLSLLTEEHLKDDCAILNGVHRTRILDAVQKIGTDEQFSITEDGSHANCDVFISYRRKNGSHLASLLKVHLQLLGYKVFLDVESLGEGEFHDFTLRSAKYAKVGFILILTPGSLDKCAIDTELTDWLHKEIVTAITNRINVIPVTTEGFQWPMPDQLPADMKQICFYNGIKWVHDYQDACIDKIDKFLKGSGKAQIKRGPSVYGSRNILNHSASVKSRNPQPTQVVRPSGSTDNLVSGERPRQRASPPGQASHASPGAQKSSPSQSTASRDVAGSVRDSTRRLDQADGASSIPRNVGQYPAHPKTVSNNSSANAQHSPSPIPSKRSSRNVSTVSLASNKSQASTMSLKKDLVALDQVVNKDQDSSSESNTESQESASASSEYTSSSEDEEEVKNVKRSGADGKSQPAEVPKQPQKANSQPPSRASSKMENVGSIKTPGYISSSTVSPISSPERRKSSKSYHAPLPPTLSTTPTTRSESEGLSPSPKPRRSPSEKPLETSLDSPVKVEEVDLDSEIHKVESEKSNSSYEESSSGEEEFHSTTRSVEDLHTSGNKTPVETIEESSEHEEHSSSSSSEEEEEEVTSSSDSDQETVKEDQDSNSNKHEKESTDSKEEINPVEPAKVLEANGKSEHTESDTEVFATDNQSTLPHTNNKMPITVLSESDFTDDNEEASDKHKKESSSSSDSESEKDESRKNGDGSDHEDDEDSNEDEDEKKPISSCSSVESEATTNSRNNSSSAPSELDVQPMEVMKNVRGLSANTNSNNNKASSPPISRRPRLSDDTDSSNASRSPPKIHSGTNKLLARVDIAPTNSELQYSPRRSPSKMVTHPSRMAQSPRSQQGYGQPAQSGIPPYTSSHMPRTRQQPIQSHPSQYQGYPYHKPMTSASLNALYPPHPTAMQQPPVKRASSRGSLRSNSTGSRLQPHARFDTAV